MKNISSTPPSFSSPSVYFDFPSPSPYYSLLLSALYLPPPLNKPFIRLLIHPPLLGALLTVKSALPKNNSPLFSSLFILFVTIKDIYPLPLPLFPLPSVYFDLPSPGAYHSLLPSPFCLLSTTPSS